MESITSTVPASTTATVIAAAVVSGMNAQAKLDVSDRVKCLQTANTRLNDASIPDDLKAYIIEKETGAAWDHVLTVKNGKGANTMFRIMGKAIGFSKGMAVKPLLQFLTAGDDGAFKQNVKQAIADEHDDKEAELNDELLLKKVNGVIPEAVRELHDQKTQELFELYDAANDQLDAFDRQLFVESVKFARAYKSTQASTIKTKNATGARDVTTIDSVLHDVFGRKITNADRSKAIKNGLASWH